MYPLSIRENTPGMLTEAEAARLAELAAGKRVLELGSYTGMSAVVMAAVAVELWSVDWHRGDAEIGQKDTLGALVRNLRAFGVEHKVTLLVGRFEAVLPRLAGGFFDLVFIDGAHDCHSVRRDTREALRLVRPGGCIAWHDGERPPVLHAATETGLAIVQGPDRLIFAFA